MAEHDGFWEKLEAELDRLNNGKDSDESDPWATVDVTAPALTPEQRAVLADQPRQPRFSGRSPLPDESNLDSSDAVGSTGKPPGVPDDDVA